LTHTVNVPVTLKFLILVHHKFANTYSHALRVNFNVVHNNWYKESVL